MYVANSAIKTHVICRASSYMYAPHKLGLQLYVCTCTNQLFSWGERTQTVALFDLLGFKVSMHIVAMPCKVITWTLHTMAKRGFQLAVIHIVYMSVSYI